MSKRVYGSRASETKGPRYVTATRSFQVAEDIIPIAELKARLSEVVRSLDQRQRPLVVTLNGKPASVVMSPREYDRLVYRDRVISAIDEGLADVAAGHTFTHDEVGQWIDTEFGPPPVKRARTKKRR